MLGTCCSCAFNFVMSWEWGGDNLPCVVAMVEMPGMGAQNQTCP